MQNEKKCVILYLQNGKAGVTVTVLLVVLAVFAVIAAIVLFVLLSPLSVRIRYDEQLLVVAGFSFIKYKVVPKDGKNKKRHKQKKKEAAKKSPPAHDAVKTQKTQSSNTSQAEKKAKKEISETLKLVFEIIKSLFDALGKHASIKIDSLNVVVSKPDAADTAVDFGICTGIVSNILAFTSGFKKSYINSENVSVVPDFVSGKGSLKIDITLSAPVHSLLFGLIKGYFRGISR